MTDNKAALLKELHDRRIKVFKKSEWGEALKICEKILEVRNNDPLAAHDLCVCHYRRGDREKAREWARKTCEFFLKEQATTPVENQVRHMMTLMSVGKASSRYMRHYEVLGEILYEEGAFEAARDFFEQLTLMKGKFSRKYIYMFKCNLHLGQYEEAFPLYARMAKEFPGREGHMLVSFREYLTRHLEENQALDLYIRLLRESDVLQKEVDRLETIYDTSNANPEYNAVLRAYYRSIGDQEREYELLLDVFLSGSEARQAYFDQARLLITKNASKGMKSLIQCLQKHPDAVDDARPLIKKYLIETDRSIQEDLCKGLLAVLEDSESRNLMLDLSAELHEHELLNELRQQWSGNEEEQQIGNVSMMLQNLSLRELIRNKMKLEEFISSKMNNVTFLATDVVGSTRMKEEASHENVLITFDAYHKAIDSIVKSYGGAKFSDEGDGKIARFSRAVDAVRAARAIHNKMDEFNENDNRLGAPMVLRIGIASGQSLLDDNLTQGEVNQVADRTLDIACHLEKYGVPGEIHLSQSTKEEAELSDKEVTILGWREKSGVNAYKLNILLSDELADTNSGETTPA